MQSLSPLTALAQRYGFAPYSLFTTLKIRATPEEFHLDNITFNNRQHLSQRSAKCKEKERTLLQSGGRITIHDQIKIHVFYVPETIRVDKPPDYLKADKNHVPP